MTELTAADLLRRNHAALKTKGVLLFAAYWWILTELRL